jgi:hypothetical protein
MKSKSIIGMSLPILGVGMLAGCCTSPVGQYIPPGESCPAPALIIKEHHQPKWMRPCNYPVTERYYATAATSAAPRVMLTAGTQYDLGVRVRPYFRPWGLEPVGERIYYRQPFNLFERGRGCYPMARSWDEVSPCGPVTPAAASQWF